MVKFRSISAHMTEQEIEQALAICQPAAFMVRYERLGDCIRVYYTLEYEEQGAEHKLELLPDDIYYLDDENEKLDEPEENGDVLFAYCQLTVARGYSEIWRGNPYIV